MENATIEEWHELYHSLQIFMSKMSDIGFNKHIKGIVIGKRYSPFTIDNLEQYQKDILEAMFAPPITFDTMGNFKFRIIIDPKDITKIL